MSESQSRPARGRSAARGGRGGPAARGPRTPNKQTNGDAAPQVDDTSADQGELGELKRRYQSQLSTAKELFPDWTDVDLVLALAENDGDLQDTIEKISEGNVSQFAEVKKAKDRSRSKVAAKDTGAPGEPAPTLRGPRPDARPERRGDSVRGGRGRGTDRGRGGFRGGARGGAPANGARPQGASVPTTESAAWDLPTALAEANEDEQPASAPVEQTAPEPEAPKAKATPAAAASSQKTWASMFAAPKPVPAVPKPAAKPAPAPVEPSIAPAEPPAHQVAQEQAIEAEELPIAPVAAKLEITETVVEAPAVVADEKLQDAAPVDIHITPSKDELTKDNVEHLPDDSHAPPTETAASTVASSRDVGVATPLNPAGQAPIGRPVGGYAASALKATSGGAPRSASYQRRILEQQEAVVMPGNHAVDRAAVQFGSLGLNGEIDADSLDVDEDREEAETRPQPPQHSPLAQPRAALPPAPRQAPPAAEPQVQDTLPTPKQAPGLPSVPQQHPISQQSPPSALGAQPASSQNAQAHAYNQFGRYNQGIQQDASAQQQKPYDPFGHQTPQANQYDQYIQQGQQQPHSQAGGFSSGPDSFGSQYLTTDQQRSAYQQYYQGYGQQQPQSQQEAGSTQQRTGSAFGSGPSDSTFPPSQQQQSQARYNEAQNSGHTTPNPALGAQHPTGPASQAQHMHQPHAQPGQHTGGYPYNHPYYNNAYYANYVNQFGNYGQQGYGGFGGGKGMYGQPQQHYGMTPQTSFDQHSASPANTGFARDSGLGASGLADYASRGSGAPQAQHGATAGSFGGLPDAFGRSQGYPNQNSAYGQQQAGQLGATEDSLKPFGDAKSAGPSPSALGAQPGRPGSATNNTPGQSGQGLPAQSHQQGFNSGYPGHLNQMQAGQNSQYGGLGGLGHQGAGNHQQQQAGGYGSYGGFGGSAGGYGSYNRGGWGTNYGQH